MMARVLFSVLACFLGFSHAFTPPQLLASRVAKLGGQWPSIRMEWSPPPITWTPCKVVDNSQNGEGLKSIKLEASVTDQFVTPGQYVQVKTPDSELAHPYANIYAIASAPAASKDGVLEFLIKEGESSTFIVDAEAGTELEISGVQGKGFPVAGLDDSISSVDILCTGSGISPIRSVIESGLLEGKQCRLFYGVRSPDHVSFADKFDDWKGVDVVTCVSQPGDGWEGETGYVTDVLKAQGIADPAATAVLLCGQKEMGIAAKEYLADIGVENVLTNF